MAEAEARLLGRELEELARAMRGSLGGLRAAAETLEEVPDLAGEPRARLLAVVAQESARLGELVRRLERAARASTAAGAAAPHGALTVGELMTDAAAAAVALGYEVEVRDDPSPVAPETALEVPGPTTIAAFGGFLATLRREMAVSRLQLRARLADRHVLFDLGWSPDPGDLPRLLDWQGEALDAPGGSEHAAAPGLRPLAREHDGEAWFNLDRDGSAAHVKVLLPVAAEVGTPTG